MAERYEAIVVGAGPAGNAAALTLARAGIDVLQLERTEYPGSKNAHGAILHAPALDELIPDFREQAPLERPIVELRMWTLDTRSLVATHYCTRAPDVRPNRYTILRGPFDAWFSSAVKHAGVRVVCATAVTDVIREEDGRVVGVRTDRGEGELYADVVLLADGVEALVARRSGLREQLEPMEMALTVKELRRLPREAIDDRFGVSGDDGVMVEATGSFAEGIPGTGYIYTNTNSLSVGVGCPLAAIVENDVTPSELLDRFKQHPAIRPLLEGGEAARFAAQLLPEGGYRSRPGLFGDGWVTCGDAAQVNDALHREGSTMALTSGRLAAETIVELKRHGRPMTARHLSLYRDKLEQSSVLKDFRKDRDVLPASRRDSSSVSTDPRVLTQAARTLVANPGFGARARHKEFLRSLSRHRAPNALINDAI